MAVDWIVILVAMYGAFVKDRHRCQNDFDVSVVNVLKSLENHLVRTLDIVESVVKRVDLLEKKSINLQQF